MTKIGPGRRRLSRGEWKQEQEQAKEIAANISKISERHKVLNEHIEEVMEDRRAWNKELFKSMNEDFRGVFKAHEIHAEDTQLLEGGFETFHGSKLSKKKRENGRSDKRVKNPIQNEFLVYRKTRFARLFYFQTTLGAINFTLKWVKAGESCPAIPHERGTL